MRITTWNVNGLRAAAKKRFTDHVREIAPDALLMQEVRALPEQLPPTIAAPDGWHALWHPAERKGYAGTAIWSRRAPSAIARGFGPADTEGRVLSAHVDGVQLVSLYLPSGASSPERQAAKDAFLISFEPWLRELLAASHPVIVGGDFNIAPTADDIWDPVGNKNNSGFLPHEREWFAGLLDAGWTDLVRAHIGPSKRPYSWWSNRGQARAKDRGWRIDHLIGNAAAAKRSVAASIHREGGLDTSDHAPVTVELR